MLFYENLEEIIFHRHELFPTDELVVLSGYLGPHPVSRLQDLPFPTKVIYGMYGSDGIKSRLHNVLIDINENISNTTIYYSKTPIHSKCYIWKRNNSIVHALIGSANFSTNGLSTPYREVLAETTYDTFSPLEAYLTKILDKCILCNEHVVTIDDVNDRRIINVHLNPNICVMTLLDPSNGQVPNASGLNWGHGSGNTTPNDAYIAIRSDHIRNHPQLFPPKQTMPITHNSGRVQRHNESIEIIWDDGTTMEGLLEGTHIIDNIIYPKQISSSPEKNILGKYMRDRLGVPLGSKVIRSDLDRYGRDTINISLQSEGVYFFDFSV